MKFLTFQVIKKPLIYVVGAVIVVVGGISLLNRGGTSAVETMVVQPGPFVREVSVSGKVVAAQDVDLAFSETGRVASVRVKVGDRVSTGQVLATVAIDTLTADLRAAQDDLAEVQKEQDTLVQSAYRTLLSDELAVVPEVSDYTARPPTLTGLYNGPEGTYTIRVEHGVHLSDDDHELQISGIEKRGPVEVLRDEPTPLGTHGLFVSFPDSLNSYDGTTWDVAIPNPKSSSYRSNYSVYQEALRMRDKVLATAQAKVRGIQTDIAERSLRAPFSGIVTAIDAKVGGIALTNESAISLISAGNLQIESFVPEVNVPLLAVHAPATITLDAYGPAVPFMASVISIDPAETVRDGVSTYRAILQFSIQDARIKPGMTANIVITTDRRENIISIPQGLIREHDGKKFVEVQQGEGAVEREVATGNVSSAGSIEIISGLTAGETIILTKGS
ncbi:MAG TPA: HlyD family efflux transporter periplasmic adaptor subunit [Candidatus Paceibacterota bacterium]|nr:HlyD family efflux transporter periplasmic adaptor subunit [Candidatus Paceibacterota bacterium]